MTSDPILRNLQRERDTAQQHLDRLVAGKRRLDMWGAICSVPIAIFGGYLIGCGAIVVGAIISAMAAFTAITAVRDLHRGR